ncbi:Clavaminate synthase-like protein [Guyanagaster necrorhizus]|uniref:Clavaminate synthase-like protein n=1 Tax=Guyanagaster necrorhizus TaxID=856835 RepID=A0A9P7VHZ1_9AGAR|nr:Clavaminate synthase-like protein [Guyanagaster necrorhizus MCA 3950]KAG7440381.1 Clavaminate synthase-like protein [Guyanagaster necrorhizus MCA 3950]
MAIEVEHYIQPPATEEPLDYADLPIIDLSKAPRPDENQRIFDIADIPFSVVNDEEKRHYEAEMMQTGSYQGYKLRQYWHIDNGVKDQIEHYNFHRDVTMRQHPECLRPYLGEIETFMKHNHFNVLHPILRLLALSFGLPENALVDIHGYSSVGETFYFGSITILYSQPVSALQILTPSGDWKWVKHIENALVINAGDALEFLSGEVFRSTIHRVVQPPQDQQGCPRLGVFYFAMPDDNVKLLPLVDNKVLSRRFVDADAPTMGEWRKGRIAAYGKTQLRKAEGEERVEEEVVAGVVTKHYN